MKILARIMTAACMAVAATTIQAQNYPGRPVQLVVGFPPGGGVDIVARQLAEKLSQQLGQQVIVDNKAGAAGNIAMEYVARAKPDGYTLLMGNLGMLSANPALYPKLPFDPAKDFVPV
ncbi:MAG: tripartite tricarboxylate transporter substrate-binding protein, partial [Casimicrobiaceae bacterium]